MTDFATNTSSPQKRIFISDLSLGGDFADIFLLASARQGQAKNGPYWMLEFKDASGSINGKIWSPQSQAFPELVPGVMALVSGRVTSYRDKLELGIDSMRILAEEESALLHLADFMPASTRRPEDMLDELRALSRKTLTHKPWRKFINSVLDDEAISRALHTAPAAKAMHHAYAGGLIEHTLSVAKLAQNIADHYPQLDRQLLFAAAVCHDLGKIWELSSGLTLDYTQSGRLLGHIPLALEKLAPFLKKSGLEPELVEHFQHLILSHHGTREFGSPTLPATSEALILHYADNIDAKMQQVEAALSGVAEGESGWSAYVPSLERFLFRAVRTPESGRAARGKGGTADASDSNRDDAAPSPPVISQGSLLS